MYVYAYRTCAYQYMHARTNERMHGARTAHAARNHALCAASEGIVLEGVGVGGVLVVCHLYFFLCYLLFKCVVVGGRSRRW